MDSPLLCRRRWLGVKRFGGSFPGSQIFNLQPQIFIMAGVRGNHCAVHTDFVQRALYPRRADCADVRVDHRHRRKPRPIVVHPCAAQSFNARPPAKRLVPMTIILRRLPPQASSPPFHALFGPDRHVPRSHFAANLVDQSGFFFVHGTLLLTAPACPEIYSALEYLEYAARCITWHRPARWPTPRQGGRTDFVCALDRKNLTLPKTRD